MNTDLQFKNWRWNLHKFNKEHSIDSDLHAMTAFLVLTILAILIFIIIATYLQKFRYTATASFEDRAIEPELTNKV